MTYADTRLSCPGAGPSRPGRVSDGTERSVRDPHPISPAPVMPTRAGPWGITVWLSFGGGRVVAGGGPAGQGQARGGGGRAAARRPQRRGREPALRGREQPFEGQAQHDDAQPARHDLATAGVEPEPETPTDD